MPSKSVNVFVSYSRIDTSLVTPVVKLLRVNKSLVFQDIDNIRPGKVWRKEITKGLADSHLVIVFWCDHSQSSKEVTKEWKTALRLKKDLLPLLLDDTPLPEKLNAFQGIDFRALVGESHAGVPPIIDDLDAGENISQGEEIQATEYHQTEDRTCYESPSPRSPAPSIEWSSASPRRWSLISTTAVALVSFSLLLWVVLGQWPKNSPISPLPTTEHTASSPDSLSLNELILRYEKEMANATTPEKREELLKELEVAKKRRAEIRRAEEEKAQAKPHGFSNTLLTQGILLLCLMALFGLALVGLVRLMEGLDSLWNRVVKRARMPKPDTREDQNVQRSNTSSIEEKIKKSPHPRISIDFEIGQAIDKRRSRLLAYLIEEEITKRIGLEATVSDSP